MVGFDGGVVGGTVPVDGADGCVARSDPGPDLLFAALTVRVAFRASEESDSMTGQAIDVTGGSAMHSVRRRRCDPELCPPQWRGTDRKG